MEEMSISEKPGSQSPAPATPGRVLVQRLARYNFDQEDLEAFAAYLDRASEAELFRMNPRRAADKAEIDLRRAIEISAIAVREGIFDLLWEVACSGCGGPLVQFDNLNAVPSGELSCRACGRKTIPDADHYLRVLFALNPAVTALNLPPLPFLDKQGFSTLEPEEFYNSLSPEQMAIFMEMQQLWQEHPPITGLDLMHIQVFRDFFKDQVLPVNVSLKVTRVALIFTDLRGSTAMYAAKGDPIAYNVVRQHFEILASETVRYGGVIIKTIGDAVMASFRKDIDAARAATAFQHAIAEFNRQNNLGPEEALILKVGVHSGPCLNVNQNDLLDYFGTTVNMAARITGLSKGGDIIMSKAMLENDEVREAVVSAGFGVQDSLQVTLRGLPDQTEVCQLVPVGQLHLLEEGPAPPLLVEAPTLS